MPHVSHVIAATLALLATWLLAWAVAGALGPAPPKPATLRVADGEEHVASSETVIAPPEQALTLARYRQDGELHLMRVSSWAGGQVRGVLLSGAQQGLPADPIEAYKRLGFEALRIRSGRQVVIAASELVQPFDGTAVQVATGINYPEHGREVAVEEGFLFPKLVRPGHFLAPVGTHGGLLDHEIELGFVALAPLMADTLPQHVGLVLASDYTDRAALLRGIDLGAVSSGRGFTEAKSQPDFMPVGPLLVIPVSTQAFVNGLHLRLWVNGQLRQHAKPATMRWDWPRIVAETFSRQALRWQAQGRVLALPVEGGSVPSGTLFLSGTPAGVVFQAPSARQKFMGASERVFTLRWGDQQVLVEPLIRESYRAGIYLQAGDTVLMQADFLGAIRNAIVAGAGPVPTPP